MFQDGEPALLNQVRALRKGLDGRTRTVISHGLAAAAIKGGALIVAFAMLPVYLNYFSNDALLGFWLASISVVNWILTFDMGIGNGMRNAIVRSLAVSDYVAVRRAVAGAYGGSITIAALLALLLGVGYNFVAITSIGSLGSLGSDGTAMGLLTWLIATVLVQLVLRNINFVLYGIQRSFVTNLMALTTSLGLLACVLLATLGGEPEPGLLGPIYMLCVNAPSLTVTGVAFWRSRQHISRWKVREFVTETPAAFRTGGGFMVNQLLFTAMMGTTAIMVSWVAGVESVVEYQAHYTLFSVAGLVSMLALTPAWSMITKALAEHDELWIERLLRSAELAALLLCLIPIGTAIFAGTLFDYWLPTDDIVPSVLSSLAFVTFSVGVILHGVVATFAAGMGRLRLQRAFYAVGFLAKLALCASLVGKSQTWALIPLLDGCVLLAYFAVERSSIRRRLRVSVEPVFDGMQQSDTSKGPR